MFSCRSANNKWMATRGLKNIVIKKVNRSHENVKPFLPSVSISPLYCEYCNTLLKNNCKKFCSDYCSDQFHNKKAIQVKAKIRSLDKPTWCLYCKKTLPIGSARIRKKFCDIKCKNKYH